jgi:hypothetical protein
MSNIEEVFEKKGVERQRRATLGCLLPGFVLRWRAADGARVTGRGSPAPAEGLVRGVAARGGPLAT